MTLVLIGKDLVVLKGSTTKIEDKQVPGIYIYISIYIYINNGSLDQRSFE